MHQHKTWILLFLFFSFANIPKDSSALQNQANTYSLFSQSEVPVVRLIYGISFGGYFAHSSTANYYNGSGEHSVEAALNRKHNRDRLIGQIPEIIEEFEIGELPLSMNYQPAVQIGFYGGFNFSESFAVVGEFNYAKLSVSDRFTIFTDKYTSTTEPYRLLADIFASEERIDLRLGFQYTRLTQSYIHPFMESGLSITDTKVLENRVNVDGLIFNIREIRTDYYDLRDYGMGFGIYTSLGVRMDVSEQFNFRLGGSINYSRINLGSNNEIRPQYTLFFRLNLHDVFRPATH